MNSYIEYIIKRTCIFLITVFCLFSNVSAGEQTAADKIYDIAENNTSSPLYSKFSAAFSLLANENPVASGTSLATGYATNAVQQWLKQFGTAHVKLNVDENGNWDNSAIDLLTPLYDDQKSILYLQPGLRAPDGRITGNLGLGVRTFYIENWMFGGNVFFDNDFTGRNRRVGIGAEVWTNLFKFSTNTYLGTTKWHQSADLDGYNEKPADGYDIRSEGYLPAYPQVGAKLMYEKYYGEDVALFDKDHLQNNPAAITVGLNYTPVPLITAAIDYKRGQDSMNDTIFGIEFRYNIGQPWSEQISSSQVALLRSLAGSRYDLVERNNEIILQYQKKHENNVLADLLITSEKDNSPADGTSANIISIKAVNSAGASLPGTPVSWLTSGTGKLTTTAGVTNSAGYAEVSVTDKSAEQVIIQASSGSLTRSVPSHFMPSVSTVSLTISKNNSIANGVDQNEGIVTVKDGNGQGMSNVPLTWKVDNGAMIARNETRTDAQGHGKVYYTNNKSGNVALSVNVSGQTASANSVFSSAAASTIAVTMLTDGSPADGMTKNVAEAILTDREGKPVANATINWTITGSAVLAGASSVTNAQGKASMSLTDSREESDLTLTAASNGLSGTATTSFITVPLGHIEVSMKRDGSPADGMTKNVAEARLTDIDGKPVANATLTWTVTGSAKVAGETSVTNSSGIASMNVIDTVVEDNLTLTVMVDEISNTTTTSFITVPVGQVAVIMTQNNALADGTTTNVAQATVTDSAGKPMVDEVISWSATGSATPAGETSVTNDKGLASMSYTDNSADKGLTVTATLKDKSGSTNMTFNALLGDVGVLYPNARTVINESSVRSGLKINVSYQDMKEGDKITVHFDIQGQLSPSSNNQILPNHDFPVYTVTKNDIGKEITFIVPADEAIGLQPLNGDNEQLTGTATAAVDRPSTGEHQEGMVQKPVDTAR